MQEVKESLGEDGIGEKWLRQPGEVRRCLRHYEWWYISSAVFFNLVSLFVIITIFKKEVKALLGKEYVRCSRRTGRDGVWLVVCREIGNDPYIHTHPTLEINKKFNTQVWRCPGWYRRGWGKGLMYHLKTPLPSNSLSLLSLLVKLLSRFPLNSLKS